MNRLDAASVEFVPILAQPAAVREAIRQLRNSPGVRQYMYSDHEISVEEHARWLAGLDGNDNARVLTVVWQGDVVGLVSLNPISARDRTASWAFYLSEQVQGMGIGAVVEFKLLELAFTELGLAKLNCEVLASNMKVVAMHQKFGFKIEGNRRQNVLKDNTRMDVLLLGVLASEWAQQRPRFVRLFGC